MDYVDCCFRHSRLRALQRYGLHSLWKFSFQPIPDNPKESVLDRLVLLNSQIPNSLVNIFGNRGNAKFVSHGTPPFWEKYQSLLGVSIAMVMAYVWIWIGMT